MLQKLTEVPANYQHRFLVQAVPTTETEIKDKESWLAMSSIFYISEINHNV